MFEDVELYIRDLKKYYDDVLELNEEGLEVNDKKRKDLDSKFKDKIRKYLPSSLNIINSNFNCKFSLYKEGQDFDASFKMIETKVRKTKEEVSLELMNLRNSVDINSLSDKDKRQVELATEILTVYSDDDFMVNIGQSKFLNEAMSIVDEVKTFDNNIQEQPSVTSTSNEIQYNPYAGQPIDLSNNYSESIDTNSFNNMTNNESTSLSSMDANSSYASKEMIDVNSLSIFGSNPNNNQ